MAEKTTLMPHPTVDNFQKGLRCPRHKNVFLLPEAHGWWCTKCKRYIKNPVK